MDKYDSIPETLPPPISPTIKVEVTPTDLPTEISPKTETEAELPKNYYVQNLQLQPLNLGDESDKKKKFTLDVNNEPTEDMKKSDSNEFLSPSPVFQFGNFENQSFDMLTTPDDSFLMGLSNINYDIEFSDISGENSINEEPSPEKSQKSCIPKDPFSPVDNNTFLITQEPLKPLNIKPSTSNNNSQILNKKVLPLTPSENQSADPTVSNNNSLIDNVETGTPENLPSPIKPVSSEYKGFSTQGWQIPSIPCHTGDYSSLNIADSQSTNAEQADEDTQDSNGSKSLVQGATVAQSTNGVQAMDVTQDPNGQADNVQNAESKPKKEAINNDDGAIRVLGGVLETFDKLF